MTGFKAWFDLGRGGDDCHDWGTNALVFATAEEAQEYGSELMTRWFVPKACEARPAADDQPVNYAWRAGSDGIKRLVRLPEPPPNVDDREV